ncbi:helix-turn-helix domain-containing protein [Companilactobacillus halodurans]|uniref:Helix-turn-helix domain-containing protein n=1 Tax=Companilactobacillus halodurans TaxID=2584183 RepID=A0A5P0ZXU1_9LACO|nr:helix-turn-helix domain-containing protein [Companilactobacillus halodurans]MQS75190.1 helix-turn-helix domain-containing protein [Companilactobacillus halodurans]MQS97544.1 helix-turn-helix domain-containing protein [Companilactobacillus halodurans]
MTKFNLDLKLKVVHEYLNGEGSVVLGRKYQISSFSIFNWAQRYQKYGVAGLKKRTSGYDYDGDYKLKVLKWKSKHNASYSKTALNFDISNPGTIANWQKKLNIGGVSALYSQRDKKSKNKFEFDKLDKLEQENRNLHIENAYLKKLHALIQQ